MKDSIQNPFVFVQQTLPMTSLGLRLPITGILGPELKLSE